MRSLLINKYDTNKLLVLSLCQRFSLFVGAGTRKGGQEETREYGLLSDARGGEIKRGNVTTEWRTLCNARETHVS